MHHKADRISVSCFMYTDWVNKCTSMSVTDVVGRGALRKTWRSCVKRDMKAMDIKEEIAQDRCALMNIGVRPALARMPYIPCVFGVTDIITHMVRINSSILKTWMLPLEFCSYVVCVHAGILLLTL